MTITSNILARIREALSVTVVGVSEYRDIKGLGVPETYRAIARWYFVVGPLGRRWTYRLKAGNAGWVELSLCDAKCAATWWRKTGEFIAPAKEFY